VDEFGFEMPELEYGEGDELEDVSHSHDMRLFDDEDGGAGAEWEAERFFGGGRAGGGRGWRWHRRVGGEDEDGGSKEG
jgi:hypothetical protein